LIAEVHDGNVFVMINCTVLLVVIIATST